MRQGGARGPRWLLVIAAGERELHDLLRRHLDGTGVQVLLDRRRRDRRRASAGPAIERRTGERRRAGWAGLIAEATRAAAPAEAAAGAPDDSPAPRCPRCGATLDVELPRFPHPPARIEVEVTHVETSGREAHYAEIAAFSVSGRRLLSQRVPARRRR
jgi:hypothetical protein